jgi:hypothetical protein
MAEFSEFTATNAMAVFPSMEIAPRFTGKPAAGRVIHDEIDTGPHLTRPGKRIKSALP